MLSPDAQFTNLTQVQLFAIPCRPDRHTTKAPPPLSLLLAFPQQQQQQRRSDRSDQSSTRRRASAEQPPPTLASVSPATTHEEHLPSSKHEHKQETQHTHTHTAIAWPSTRSPSRRPPSRARRRTPPSQVRFRSNLVLFGCLVGAHARVPSADTQAGVWTDNSLCLLGLLNLFV